jgi:hypothetical protein
MPGFVKPALFGGGACLVLLFASVFTPAVHAAGNTSTGSVLTTSPVSVDLVGKPGSTTSTNLEVQNNGTRPITVNVKLDEFKAGNDNGRASIFTPPANDPSTTWVHFSKESFVAEPGVWNQVAMTINVPKTAAYGYYYAVLFEPDTSVSGLHNTTNKVKGANAVFVLLDAHIPGEKNTLQVTGFRSDKSVYQYLPASFSVTIRNTGNIFTVPQGDIFISRTSNGAAMASMAINSGQGNILPGTNRIFSAKWNDGFPVYVTMRIDGQIVSDKNGKPVQQLHWNAGSISKFRFGKYYAHLVLVYKNGSGQDVPVSAVVSFWVIPWALLGVLLIVLVLVLFGVWTIMKDTTKIVKWFRKPSEK